MDRRARIGVAVRALALGISDHTASLSSLREAVRPVVPEVDALHDLRLMDIVIWTSQDDRMSPRNKPLNRWLDGVCASHMRADDFLPVRLSAGVTL